MNSELSAARHRFRASGVLSFWAQANLAEGALKSLLLEASGHSLEVTSGNVSVGHRRPSDPVQRTLAVLDKQLTRGVPTWVDHHVEVACRETAAAKGWLLGNNPTECLATTNSRMSKVSLGQGLKSEDLCLKATPALWGSGVLLGQTPPSRAEVESRIPSGSSSEDEWLFYEGFAKLIGARLQWRVIAQPEFCDLLGVDPSDVGPGRRPDFAFSVGKVRWVFEIDGVRKYEEGYELAEENIRRDRALRAGGWKVARIPTTVCRTGLEAWLKAWWEGAELEGGDRLDPSERDLIEVIQRGIPQEGRGPEWPLIVAPHLAQGLAVGLLQLVRWGCLGPRIRSRILVLAEEPAPFRLGFAQALRAWSNYQALDSAALPPPVIDVNVVGSSEELDFHVSSEFLTVSYSNEPSGTYDMIISFGPSIFEDVSGSLEHLVASIPAPVVIRWRRPVGLVNETPLQAADLHFPLSIGEAESFRTASQLFETRSDRMLQVESALEFFLAAMFRKAKFREGQLQAVSRVLSGESALVLLPTGSGKSIVYQLSALLLPGMSIIVDPLVTLMADQVENLRGYGIDRVTKISSEQDILDKVQAQLELGRGLKAFVFIAPHRMQMQTFREALRDFSRKLPISLAVIDEAHCVSEWGHGFMTPYLQLGKGLRENAKSLNSDGNEISPVFLGLTGTASFSVLTDVQIELGIKDERAIVLPEKLDRPELRFEVIHASSDPKRRMETLRQIRASLPERFESSYSSFFTLKGKQTASGLTFCPHVNGPWGVHHVANELKINHYFSGSQPKDRCGTEKEWKSYKITVQKRFKSDDIQELVVTKAFGMGIDKPNIRFTVHVVIPSSVEAFYQEAGRAGRDREPSWCAILFDRDFPGKDEEIQAWFLKNNFKDQEGECVLADLLWRKELAPALKDVGLEYGTVLSVRVPFGMREEREIREKALCRLVWLGVVEEYLVDWETKQFVVKARKSRPQEVLESLKSYFRRYKFEEEITKLTDGIPHTSTAEAVSESLRRLIGFAYTEIQEKRHHALGSMVRLCLDYRNEEQFRQGIMAYLEESRFSKELRNEWLKASWDEIGEQKILKILAGVTNRDDARRLLGTTRRLLDENPRNIPIRVLSLLAASRICEDPRDEEQVVAYGEALAGSLQHPELAGVNDPCLVYLFAIEQADLICSEPFEGEQSSEDKKNYQPELFSKLSRIFFTHWSDLETWRSYLGRLRALPSEYGLRIIAQFTAGSLGDTLPMQKKNTY